MKKENTNLFIVFLAMLCIAIGSCKVNDSIRPTVNENSTMASIPVLKTYLSQTLAVSEDEISYDKASHDFVIRKGIIMKENEVQSHYRVANEYKTRNKILN